MEHAKERMMIYTSAGEKTLKIKKDKLISCFKKLPDGGSITGYVTFRRKYLLSGENISNLSDSSFIQVENTNYVVRNKKGCTKKIIGYIETDIPDKYIAIVKSRFMPIWLTALCYNSLFPAILISAALVGAIACGGIAAYHQLEPGNVHIGAPGKTKEPTKNDDISDYDGMDGLEDTTETEKYTIIDTIAYDGEYLEVNPSDTIPLGNNKENDGVYLQFIVKNADEEEVYVSPKLNPGEKVDWSPCEYLDEGIQKAVITVNVYHSDTNMQDVGTDLNVSFKVNK